MGPVGMWSLVHGGVVLLHPRRRATGVVLHRVAPVSSHARHGVGEIVGAAGARGPPAAAAAPPVHVMEGPVFGRAGIHPGQTVLRGERGRPKAQTDRQRARSTITRLDVPSKQRPQPYKGEISPIVGRGAIFRDTHYGKAPPPPHPETCIVFPNDGRFRILTGGGWLFPGPDGLGPLGRGGFDGPEEAPTLDGTGASPSSAIRDKYSLSMRALSWAD